MQGSVTLQGTIATEKNREGDASLDSRSLLYRVAWEGQPAAKWKLQLAATGQRARFGDVDPAFGVRRNDRFLSFDATLTRSLSKGLSWFVAASRAGYRSTADALYNNWRSLGGGVQLDF